ncbi:MAG: preprotein translocase subunit YajC [Rhodospirillales bacterium]|nr:preprotein translocase subunit YajC [Rhodospirillales bacterium]MDH3790162.1 preprotein translocase subunit YajC [Rhodospirillales bacterium]MDH3913864.1 preprotein translocase subunit YajC [Rhodospirillales bacterium]MDH3918038.1 preprotein translocase subunit YajC [Rhodospirillales bacterium]MDH3969024.1 preprotein translocase subunit YajC [Rhodospirillales bacterium]
MFISPAYAQALGGDGASTMTSLLPLVLIFVVFYLLLIRPQQKKMKQHRDMVAALRRGDRVVTGGGLVGTVTKVVSDTELQVEVAEGVKVRVVRATISEVLAKTEPGKDKGEKGQTKTAEPANDSGKGGGLAGGLGRLLGGGRKS